MTTKLHFIFMRIIMLAYASIASMQSAENLSSLPPKHSPNLAVAFKYRQKQSQAAANVIARNEIMTVPQHQPEPCAA